MLIATLNDLLKETRGKRGHLTGYLLDFNHRIAQEIVAASDQKRLMEYLGFSLSKDVKCAHQQDMQEQNENSRQNSQRTQQKASGSRLV